ncbi:hypothetical protein OVA13_15965 [Pseudoxanthomonas sp. SL93]|jgi:hypothetical protein|uniref:hypothetical protein n=1 Tax=Pseudoxanthomonas sp. SL93 TaxID=2995142 RepID=UPI002270B8EB|nr:hypothetical protein [Pseudoxanthomonas sp. SL93]WAC62859.1 hypothetical protein OVA13_15965 [Pseudoxanthomonas sp. SL93]
MSIPSVHVSSPARHAPAPQLDHALRSLLLAGLALVLLLPVARASTAWLGWMPLWLVGMPAVAWWALHRFRLPAWPARAGGVSGRRRRGQAQARRRARPARIALARAA